MSQGVGSIDLNAAEEAYNVKVEDGVDGEAERHCTGKAHSCAMPCRAVKHGMKRLSMAMQGALALA